MRVNCIFKGIILLVKVMKIKIFVTILKHFLLFSVEKLGLTFINLLVTEFGNPRPQYLSEATLVSSTPPGIITKSLGHSVAPLEVASGLPK